MKSMLFVGLFSLVMGSALASTVDSKSVVFDGSNGAVSLQLKAEKTHTEYRYETVNRICYRTIVDYRQVCRRPTPTRPGQCWTEPVYRQVAYPCTETISIPYEVFDNYVDANVAINFGEVPAGINANENVTATLNGDLLTLKSNGSKALVLELASLQQNRRMSGNVLMIDAVATVKLHDAAAVKRALTLSDASIKKSVMTYNLGPIAGVQLAHSLKIVDSPVLGGDTVLFDAEMGAALAREERGATTAMTIAFRDLLGRDLGEGRYNITAKAFFKAGAGVLNAAELGDLSVEKTILYKIK